jgi:hypothetical protein
MYDLKKFIFDRLTEKKSYSTAAMRRKTISWRKKSRIPWPYYSQQGEFSDITIAGYFARYDIQTKMPFPDIIGRFYQ